MAVFGDSRLPQKFWRNVRVDQGGCWIWTLTLDGKGYGYATWTSRANGQRARKLRTHRIAYEALVGPIPEDLEIDHLCRKTACCFPGHLEPVTHAENVRRGAAAAAARARHERTTHCPAGHSYAGSNLYVEPRTNKRRCRTCYAMRARVRRRKRGKPARPGAWTR